MDLDLRGTTLHGELSMQILNALTEPQSGRLSIGEARLDAAEFAGDVQFDGAEFTGEARFSGVQFGGRTSFSGTVFRGVAWFAESTFVGKALFSNAQFKSPTSLADAKFRNDVVFNYAEFSDEAFFNSAEFSGAAKFYRTTFHEMTVFSRAKFNARTQFEQAEFRQLVLFNSATFADAVKFDGATFNRRAAFNDVRFNGESRFDGPSGGAKFSGDAEFSKATFSRDAQFQGVQFCDDAVFSDVRFEKDAVLDNVQADGDLRLGPSLAGRILMSQARVSGTTRVIAEAEAVACNETEFHGRVWLSMWGGELWLIDSVFFGPATVESALQPVSSAGRTAASSGPGNICRAVLRSLQGTDAEHLTLVDVDLEQCVLSGLRRPELLRLDGRCIFAQVPGGVCLRWGWMPWRWMAREALFEEHLWRRSVNDWWNDAWWEQTNPDSANGVDGLAGPGRLAVLYRQLRVAVEGAGNEPGAADLYYGEMEMRRLGAPRRGERWLLGLYWLVSGYGLRAGRAMIVLAALVFAAALALHNGGFAGRAPTYADCVLYAAGSIVSLEVIVRYVPVVLTEWGETIRLVLRVGGPVLLGLAALAVRGRVKR